MVDNTSIDFNLLPLGCSDFSTMRRDGLIYVDKTKIIAEMARNSKTLILTRHVGFGKSLLTSTLKSLFTSGVEDFRGLEIEKIWNDKTYHVIHLDFSKYASLNADDFSKAINKDMIKQIGFNREFTMYLDVDQDPYFILYLICEHNHNKLVFLIDEYDAPIIQHLNQPEELHEIEYILDSFYTVVKSYSGRNRFFLITGVFIIFGDPIVYTFYNHINLTFKLEYSSLLAFTNEDLERYFDPYLKNAANVLHISKKDLLAALRQNYGGFCFSHRDFEGFLFHREEETVYNPTSILNFLRHPEDGFKNYWSGVGGSSKQIMKYLKANNLFDFAGYDGDKIRPGWNAMGSYPRVKDIHPKNLLNQAGYLSIDPTDPHLLYPPNKETFESLKQD